MTEIEEILAEERERASAQTAANRPQRARSLIALLVGGAATLALLVGGGVLAVGASAAISPSAGPNPSNIGPESAVTTSDSLTKASEQATAPPAVTLAEGDAAPLGDGELPPGAVAVAPGGTPIYDRTTDRALLSAPPADWPQSEIDNSNIWIDQQYIIGDCMAEQGFDFTFMIWYERSFEDTGYTNMDITDAWRFAYGGDTGGGEDYHWDEAGCHGYAVHVTGMDDAN